MSGKDKERRKGGGTQKATLNTPQAPDKRKFEREVKEIGKQISDLEAKRKTLSWRSDGELKNEITKLSGMLTELETEKNQTTTEVRKVEARIGKFGPDITQKKDEANKLLAGLRHKTEERIDEAVKKLEQQLSTKQFAASEERRLQSEIDALQASKEKLKEYLSVKTEIEEMGTEQEELRKRRNSLYRTSRELREKESAVRDEVEGIRKQMEAGRERQKDIQAQKDALTQEIQDLNKARQQLIQEFRRKQSAFIEATSKSKEMEMEEREREAQRREEERRARRRRLAMEQEMQRELQFDEEKQMCRSLIAHLQKLLSGTNPIATDHTPTTSPSLASVGGAEAQSTAEPVRESAFSQKPGEFLPRKGADEGEVLVPASHGTLGRKKNKRDKRKNAPSSKAPRRLQYDPTMLAQLSSLNIRPPTTHSDISHTLQLLQDKLVFYERKAFSADSEAGDSGIGSTVLGEISEYEMNSQDDNFDPTGLSSKRHSIDSYTLDTHLPSNGDNSTPAPLVTNSLDNKMLHHSISTSTSASTTSTSALPVGANDE